MNKNLKAVIACGAALVLVGGGYTALMLTDNAPDSSSASDEPIAVKHEPILSFEKTDIKSISVKNSNGGYEGVPTGETGEDGMPVFTVKGIEDLPLNSNIVSSLLNNASALSCDSVVKENETEFEKYGLADPQAEVTIKTAKEEKSLLVGNESPQSGETYCMLKGGSDVFLTGTSAVNVFVNSRENFISINLIPETDANGAEYIPETIKITRDDMDNDIVLEKDTFKSESGNVSGTMSTHHMTEPVFSYLDVEKSQNAIQGFSGLSAYSAVYAHPTEELIKASELDKPHCIVTAESEGGESYTVKVGRKLDINDGEYYAVMINDIDVIYAVSGESLCWLTLKPGDITSKMIFGTYVWDIARLKISVDGGETVEFTGKGTDEKDVEMTKNGEKCDPKRFKEFYQFLLKTSAEEFDIEDQPQGNPQVSIELDTQDGQVSQKVEFYKAEGQKSLIVVNGRPCFKFRSAYVELLKENLSKFDSTEDFVMNW